MQTKDNTQRGKRLIHDAILLLALLVAGLSALLIMRSSSEVGASVSVRVSGEEIAVFPLDQDGEYELNGGTNILVIEGGEAYVSSASCPDKICVNYGKISRTGESIICRPNDLIVLII